MTATEPQTAALTEYALAAADAARLAVSGAGEWTTAPVDALDAGAGWRAVEARVGAARVLLVTDPDLARHLQVGPPPADDLLEGSQPALAAAVEVLAPLLGGAAIDELVEVDPADAVPGDGYDLGLAGLHAADQLRAALVVVVPAVSLPAADPAPAEAVEQLRPNRLTSVPSGLELLHDVEMGVTAELGRTRMVVRDILELAPGSVIELDRAAGSPVDVLVNGTLIARGEVVVIDEEFGIRITDVLGYEEGRSR